jgi:hypothetical protein
MDVEQIARSLGGAKQSGGNWSCKCPAHEDNKASLSIGNGRDGKLVVHCHAGCSQESVIDWLKALDMWPTTAKQTSAAAVPPVRINLGQSRGAIVATYDYVNEDGELLYQAVRYDPKDFRQRAPKPDGTWSWTIKGVRRVLYRLPEVLAAVADGKTIYICEGEKDVEAARALGLVATCNAMGADNGGGNKWLPEFADTLIGADVVVVPDQDESGKRHAGWVIKTLTGKARNLGLLNVQHGKDIADWIEAGAMVSDIEGAILDAIEEIPAAKEEMSAPAQELPRENMFVSVGDLIDDLKPIEWLVEDYIESDSLALIFGPPAGGKSFVTVDLACCIATGTPWHGRPVKQGAVFYIAGEGHNGLARRFAAWSKANGVSLKGAPLFKSTRAVAIYNEESAIQLHEDIIVMAEQHQMQPAMVAIDTVARNFGGGDENSTEDMSKFIEHVDTFIRRPFACNVNMVHHSGHNMDRARGSSALKAALDAEYAVVKEGDMLTFTATKMKDAEMPPELTFKFKVVELGEVGGHDITSVVLEPHDDALAYKVADDSAGNPITAKDVLEVVAKGWLPYDQLKDALGCTKTTATRAVKRVAEKSLLEKDGSGFKLTEKANQMLSLTGAKLQRKGAGIPIWKQREKD